MINFNGQLSEYVNLPTIKRNWFMHKLEFTADRTTKETISMKMGFMIEHESATGERLTKLDNNDFEFETKANEQLQLPVAVLDQLLTMLVESDPDLVGRRKTISDHPAIIEKTVDGHIIDMDFAETVLNRKIIDIITLIKIIVILRDMSGYINDEKLHNYLR